MAALFETAKQRKQSKCLSRGKWANKTPVY